MNNIIKKNDLQAILTTDKQILTIDGEKLLCHPNSQSNMFTINREEAIKLKEKRSTTKTDLVTISENILNVSKDIKPIKINQKSNPRNVWHALFEEIEIQPNDNVCLSGIMLSHVEDKSPHPGLLWIDEDRKWSAFWHDGFLCQALRIYEPDCLPNQPRILSLDVSGLGSLSPEPTAYDLAGWNDIERILTYLSLANSKPIMGLRVRDALCGLDYLNSRPDIDKNRLMVGGRGIGGIVALHVALLNSNIKRVICMDMLSHYGAMTEKFPFSWRQSIIIPEILKYYDLPEIISNLKDTNIFIVNPMDAQKVIISKEVADKIYSNSKAIVKCNVNGGELVKEAIYSNW
jgi:hypothetical protein